MALNQSIIHGDSVLSVEEAAQMLAMTPEELLRKIANGTSPPPRFMVWEVLEFANQRSEARVEPEKQK